MAHKKASTTGQIRKRPVTVCRRFLEKLDALPDRLPDRELCEQAGLPSAQISRWKDRAKPRPIHLHQAFRLSKALGVSLDWLADDDQDLPAPQSMPEWPELMRLIKRLGLETIIRRVLGQPGEPAPPEPAGRWVSGSAEPAPTLIGPVEGRATTAGRIPEGERPSPPPSRHRRGRHKEGADHD